MTNADAILSEVYESLGISTKSDAEKYKQIDAIVQELAIRNSAKSINAKTTGTISERLCELALKSKVNGIYKPISAQWNWMADFSILGHPFNLLISVKSFKAKERLLVSGSGNILSPTVGWGLFDDPDEWTEGRTRIYLYRSFIAIYLPTNLYNIISTDSQLIKNINGKAFLRKNIDFMSDLEQALENGVIKITSF